MPSRTTPMPSRTTKIFSPYNKDLFSAALFLNQKS
jgi:hypothetical protein